jgi:hypothetical protein
MIEQAISRLNVIIDKVPSLLAQISEEKMSIKPSSVKWSKKEIIGHLIDSATNNHQRFVRGQFEAIPEIQYDQNKWNAFGFYQDIDSAQIINFWKFYNIQLLEIIKRIPSNHLNNQIRIGGDLLALEFLIVDYVDHLEHHLRQIVEY